MMYEIKTEKELESFLKKLVENTVADAKNTLNEDPYREKFNSKYNEDLKGLIGEQEEEEEEEAEIEEEEPTEEEIEDEEEAIEDDEPAEEEIEDEEEVIEDDEPAEEEKSKNPAADKAKEYEAYTDDFSASYNDIKDAINILRAGRSLKDEEISQELTNYYELLDEDERSVLLIYLRELSKILTGAVDGDEAQDPSNAKTYFKIEKIIGKEGEDAKDSNQSNKKELASDVKEPKRVAREPVNAEDTTPPIRVNESQDFSSIKKIIGSR